MVRLHGRDLDKLKPGQLLWYVEETQTDIGVSRNVWCYKHISKASKRNGKTLHRLFNYESKYTILTALVQMKNKDSSEYFAKVTRKEEPEFIARVLEF